MPRNAGILHNRLQLFVGTKSIPYIREQARRERVWNFGMSQKIVVYFLRKWPKFYRELEEWYSHEGLMHVSLQYSRGENRFLNPVPLSSQSLPSLKLPCRSSFQCREIFVIKDDTKIYISLFNQIDNRPCVTKSQNRIDSSRYF